MKIELNDETLTAYALGELDAADTKAIEKLLADAANAGNDAPRKTLDEIRTAAMLAEAAFAENTEEHSLTVEQRRALEATASRPNKRFWTGSLLINGLAVAAILAIVAAITIPFPRNSRFWNAKQTEIVVPATTPPNTAPVPPSPTPGVDPLRYQIAKQPTAEPAENITTTAAAGSDKPADVNLLNKDDPAQQPLANPSPALSTPQPKREPEKKAEPTSASGNEKSELPSIAESAKPAVNTPFYLDAQTSNAAAHVNGASAGGKLSDSGAADVAAGNPVAAPLEEPKQVEQGPTLEFKRRPRPESASAVAAPKIEMQADTAAAAPATAPAAPMIREQFDLVRGIADKGSNEREQLRSVGYSADDRTGYNSRSQVAAIDARRYDRWDYQTQSPVESIGAESYKQIVDNGFVRVTDQPLSTFSIDVDTASYSNLRRFLEQGQLPPPDAVRVEEMINYFDYAYPAPTDGTPFAAHFEAAACPWTPAHTLVRIGLKGREIPRAQRPATNLVFLIDVSGSMQPENRLPLVKRGLAMLTRQLDERDRVTIVTYANGVNLALPLTNASQQDRILSTIDSLGAGGSTNGAGGIQLAYQSARENFLPGGVNRVILATDGDFNVGISDNDSLLALIQQEAKSGVFLSVFGFGMGNLKDDKLEMLADKGNGVYGYIDSESEARKVFVEKLSGTLVTIAKDVKIQVEFNPARVAAYRLIGYENRALAAQDFNDDRKDAGEIGAGHTVTALYEVVPAGKVIPVVDGVGTLRYQSPQAAVQNEAARAIAPAGTPAYTDELLLVKLRYKQPEGAESRLLEFPLKNQVAETLSSDLKFASAVAAFGKLLRGNPLSTILSYDAMMQLAQAGLAASDDPRRAEMIHLMLQARPLIEGIDPTTTDPSRYQPVR